MDVEHRQKDSRGIIAIIEWIRNNSSSAWRF